MSAAAAAMRPALAVSLPGISCDSKIRSSVHMSPCRQHHGAARCCRLGFHRAFSRPVPTTTGHTADRSSTIKLGCGSGCRFNVGFRTASALASAPDRAAIMSRTPAPAIAAPAPAAAPVNCAQRDGHDAVEEEDESLAREASLPKTQTQPNDDRTHHVAALCRAAGAEGVLRVANGPMGRGLFTAVAVPAGGTLLAVPDVHMLIVSDPDNEPHRGGEGSDGVSYGSVQDPDIFYSSDSHQGYLRKWQATHGLILPPGLLQLLGASGHLPAPARLAVWLMWLRNVVGSCNHAATAAGAAAGVGPGPPPAAAAPSEPEGHSGCIGKGSAAVGPGSGGVTFWCSYLASLPQPEEVTCPSVFSEEEAVRLQVPSYLRQWQNTRSNLLQLLRTVNRLLLPIGKEGEAVEEGGSNDRTSQPDEHATDFSQQDSPEGAAAAGCSYSLDELSYCYALATSRCFHLPGYMALVPYADLGNHQPLWQASAFPCWRPSKGVAAEAAGHPGAGVTPDASDAAGSSGAGAAAPPPGGWFQFRAVRELAAGQEVCICYSEGGNQEQLFSYGFIRQANPYDRVDLTAGIPGGCDDSDGDNREGGDDDDSSTRNPADRVPLCWPAVVAAAGFWAPATPHHSTRTPPSHFSCLMLGLGLGRQSAESAAAAEVEKEAASYESPAALEQALLRPREPLAANWVWTGGGAQHGGTLGTLGALLRRWSHGDGSECNGVEGGGGIGEGWSTKHTPAASEGRGAQRLRLQRRRAALLSLPHSVADVAALRRAGLSRASSPEAELRRWAESSAAMAAATSHAIGVGPNGVARAIVASRAAAKAAEEEKQHHQRRLLESQLVAVDGLQVQVGRLRTAMPTSLEHDEALWRALEPSAALKHPKAIALAATTAAGAGEAKAVYNSPRGRTALVARLEYKRVLAQAGDVLRVYRRVVERVLRLQQ